MQISIQGPGGSTADLELTEGEPLLVGRSPSPAMLQGIVEIARVRPVALGASAISGNHALIWREREHAHLRDLGSRNGSWLRLPPGGTVRVGGADRISLTLAPAQSPVPEEQPPDAIFSSTDDFAAAMVTAIEGWFKQLGLEVDCSLDTLSPEGNPQDEPERLPLPAAGAAIVLKSERTTDSRWPGLLERVHRYVVRQCAVLEAERSSRGAGLILASRAIRQAHFEVVQAANRGLRVVLLGESGAGKEGLARAYHRASGRDGPFVAVNCSELNSNLGLAALFGATRGAFTGAVDAPGYLERASGGTLFLDEIGELPADVQPMLLRFLDSGEYSRLGRYGKLDQSDVRLVCATNKDLRREVKEKRFRADLWYRISGRVVGVPALRERFEDVLAYLQAAELGGGLSARDALSEAAVEVLRRHDWHGNFRELENFVARLPPATRRGEISPSECSELIAAGSVDGAPVRPKGQPAPPPVEWAPLLDHAVNEFRSDHGRVPATWDDQKVLIEQYLKPVLFARLVGADADALPEDPKALAALASRLAGRVAADRGTAHKQLLRYASRFQRPQRDPPDATVT